jgi:hypothetical protein
MRFFRTIAPVLLFSALAFANPWTGRLVDATCYDAQKESNVDKCKVTETTSSFGLLVDGKVYKLDAAGSTQAAQIVKLETNDKSKVMAKVRGELNGETNTITVQSIEIQK